MDAGLSEVARFLAQRPPFDALAPDELAEVAAQAAIEFHPQGAVILAEGAGPVTFLRVVHSGAVDVLHEGRLLDLLGPGDAFGHAAMLAGLPPGFEARAAEDTLCYRIPVEGARPLLERARRRDLSVGGSDAAYRPVGTLIRTPTVTCRPTESIGIVAERMTAAGASAAVVVTDAGPAGRRAAAGVIGIVTDRDLRARVLAAGRSGGVRVQDAMTAPAFTVSPDRLGGEVLYEMLERGIRHAPVVAENGALVGVLEDADVYATQQRSWFWARRAIERARTLEALFTAAERLPGLMLELHHSSVPALELPPVLSALQDALTRRALELLPGSGSAPGVVWVSTGAQARRELTPGSPRRGAFVHAEEAPLPAEWLAAAGPVLRRCGIEEPIAGDSGHGWLRRAAADGDELALGVIGDRRALWGTPVDPLPALDGPERDRLLAGLARRAFGYSVPTGFDSEAVLTRQGRHPRLNVREATILPIAAIACWAAAAAGASAVTTPERLRAAAEAGVLRAGQAQTLIESFELGLELQVVHQLQQIDAGLAPDNLIDAAGMSALTRGRLRDVFRAVSTVAAELRR